MDEQDNGPIPGIVGQDTPSEKAQDGSKLFDSKEFTGISSQPESIVPSDEKKKAKKNPFTKWQTWAIISGVIFTVSMAAIVVIVIIMGGKISNAEAIAKYDSASVGIEQSITDFNNSYEKNVRSAYGISESSTIGSTTIYPSSEALAAGREKCIGRFGVSKDDLSFLETRKSGSDMLASGANIVEASERISRLVASYKSAISAIDTCNEDILSEITKDFEIELGELTTTPNETLSTYVDFHRPVKITNKGDRAIAYATFTYGLYDRNGIKLSERSVHVNTLESGATVELDLYGGIYRYSVDASNADEQKAYKPKLIQIHGSYAQK